MVPPQDLWVSRQEIELQPHKIRRLSILFPSENIGIARPYTSIWLKDNNETTLPGSMESRLYQGQASPPDMHLQRPALPDASLHE